MEFSHWRDTGRVGHFVGFAGVPHLCRLYRWRDDDPPLAEGKEKSRSRFDTAPAAEKVTTYSQMTWNEEDYVCGIPRCSENGFLSLVSFPYVPKPERWRFIA